MVLPRLHDVSSMVFLSADDVPLWYWPRKAFEGKTDIDAPRRIREDGYSPPEEERRTLIPPVRQNARRKVTVALYTVANQVLALAPLLDAWRL